MRAQGVRWVQRLASYQQALRQLDEFIEKGELNKFERQGLIKAFELTHELAWKVMKDYLEYKGFGPIKGSRDATRRAAQQGILADCELWMEMIVSRNYSVHTYHQATAELLAELIYTSYFGLFHDFEKSMLNQAHEPRP
jgi:nucleotidyltransferase substrate binding protein (TIGR01987 family)